VTTAEQENLRQRVRDAAERASPRVAQLALALHRCPELACREVHTVTRLVGEFEELGLEVETGVGGLPTAFRAAREGAGGGTVALLCEYDAIPGLGHATGHNLIGAAAWGAAAALAALGPDLPGRLVVVGAPAEETIGGKVVLAERGVYDDANAALLAHPGASNHALCRSLASWSVEVVFGGRSAHAVAAPQDGVNALDAMIQLFVGRDALLKALRPEVRMPGVILEGGVRANLVPDRVRARFSLRAADAGYLVDTVLHRFRELVEGIARATATRATVTPVDNLYDEIVPNRVLAARWEEHLRAAGLPPATELPPLIGSLDIGGLSHRIPVLHPFFRVLDRPLPTHTAEFAAAAAGPRALRATAAAARALALTALDLMVDDGLRAEVQTAHADRARGRDGRVAAPLVTEEAPP
jgi:amidohydrolase